MFNVYLSGEIHTNWREEIIELSKKEKLEINFTSPNTNHDNSDNCGVEILGPEGTKSSVIFIASVFGGTNFTSNDLLSLNQLITFPKFAFSLGGVSFFNFTFSKSKTQSSTPSDVVFVNAIIV